MRSDAIRARSTAAERGSLFPEEVPAVGAEAHHRLGDRGGRVEDARRVVDHGSPGTTKPRLCIVARILNLTCATRARPAGGASMTACPSFADLETALRRFVFARFWRCRSRATGATRAPKRAELIETSEREGHTATSLLVYGDFAAREQGRYAQKSARPFGKPAFTRCRFCRTS
jgi:hypothetical protein